MKHWAYFYFNIWSHCCYMCLASLSEPLPRITLNVGTGVSLYLYVKSKNCSKFPANISFQFLYKEKIQFYGDRFLRKLFAFVCALTVEGVVNLARVAQSEEIFGLLKLCSYLPIETRLFGRSNHLSG